MVYPDVVERRLHVCNVPSKWDSLVILFIIRVICSIVFTFRHTASQEVADGIERMWEHMRQVFLPAVARHWWCQVKSSQELYVCIRQLQWLCPRTQIHWKDQSTSLFGGAIVRYWSNHAGDNTHSALYKYVRVSESIIPIGNVPQHRTCRKHKNAFPLPQSRFI